MEILWHRRETRRQTENTNVDLPSKDSKLLAPFEYDRLDCNSFAANDDGLVANYSSPWDRTSNPAGLSGGSFGFSLQCQPLRCGQSRRLARRIIRLLATEHRLNAG